MLGLQPFEPAYVFSIDNHHETLPRFRRVMNEKRVPIRELRGKYHGTEEPSFLIPSYLFMVHIWPWIRGQETVLFLGGPKGAVGRMAKLLPVRENGLGTPIIDLSPWRMVDVHTARAQDGFTYDYATNTYWVAGALKGHSGDVAGEQPGRAFAGEQNWVC